MEVLMNYLPLSRSLIFFCQIFVFALKYFQQLSICPYLFLSSFSLSHSFFLTHILPHTQHTLTRILSLSLTLPHTYSPSYTTYTHSHSLSHTLLFLFVSKWLKDILHLAAKTIISLRNFSSIMNANGKRKWNVSTTKRPNNFYLTTKTLSLSFIVILDLKVEIGISLKQNKKIEPRKNALKQFSILSCHV